MGRFVIEGLRTDSLWLVPGVIRVSQLLSAILVVIGILYLVYMHKRPVKIGDYYGKYSLTYVETPSDAKQEEDASSKQSEESVSNAEEEKLKEGEKEHEDETGTFQGDNEQAEPEETQDK